MSSHYSKPEFILSKNLTPTLLLYWSRRMPEHAFVFSKKDNVKSMDDGSSEKNDGRYRCKQCETLGKSRDVTIRSGNFCVKKDPEDDHHPACRPQPKGDIEVLVLKREMYVNARRGKRPREAFTDAECSIPKKHKADPVLHDAVAEKFPNYEEVRRQLERHFAHVNVPVPNPTNVPEELRLTLYGKNTQGESSASSSHRAHTYDSRWLLHEGMDGKMLIFASDTDLELMFLSKRLAADGTFKYAPNVTYQFYTILAFKNEEAFPVGYCILPNKHSQTYIEMWDVLKKAVAQRQGSFGKEQKVILTDFESGAIVGVKYVFRAEEVQHKGCLFHFRNALLANIKSKGLQHVYHQKKGTVLTPDQQVARSWLQQIMALAMVPEDHIPNVWHHLRTPPSQITDAGLVTKLSSFALYFEGTWMNGMFPIAMWCHFDNDGPRTTNHCEGYHSGLQKLLRAPHPNMSTFLNWLQGYHYGKQRQMKKLDKPDARTRERRARDIALDQRIAERKLRLTSDLTAAYSASPAGQFWAELYPSIMYRYLNRMASYIGAKASKRKTGADAADEENQEPLDMAASNF